MSCVGADLFLLPEPIRRKTETAQQEIAGDSILDTLKFVSRNWTIYVSFVSLACVMTILAYGQTNFLPGSFERNYDWAPEFYAYVNGTVLLVVGPLTYLAVGFLSDRWSQEGIADAPFRLYIFGFSLMTPTAAIGLLMPTGAMAYAVLTLSTIGIAIVSVAAVTSLLLITPAKVRGQLVALYYMAISLTGLLLGPTTVGSLSTRVFGEENLHLAVSALPFIYGAVPALLIPITFKLYRQQLQRLGVSQ